MVRAIVTRRFLTGWHVTPVGVKMTTRIYDYEEGLWWARGWMTAAAKAFDVSVALS